MGAKFFGEIMFFVYVCSCGNVGIHISLKKKITQTKCSLCGKTTQRAIKRESSKTTCLYSGDSLENAIFHRRLWIKRHKPIERHRFQVKD